VEKAYQAVIVAKEATEKVAKNKLRRSIQKS